MNFIALSLMAIPIILVVAVIVHGVISGAKNHQNRGLRQQARRLLEWLTEYHLTTKAPKRSAPPSTPTPEPSSPAESNPGPTRLPRLPRDQGALERNFGTRLPVWLGGIALAFAGFFLVKYSLDKNLISPEMRVILSGVFGCVLLFLAELGRRRGIRNPFIPQALAGAGGAVLYGVAFAATSVYHFISLPWGLASITVVTGVMVLFSLNMGPAMAVLGMVSGFVSLWLVGATDVPAPFFFGYLLLLFGSLMAIIRHRGWWRLSMPAMIGVLLWAAGRTLFSWRLDSVWVWLFAAILAGITIATAHGPFMAMPREDKRRNRLRRLLWTGTIAPFGLMVLSMLVNHHGYNGLDLCLFGSLALGGAILAYWKEELYGLLPWLSLASLAGLLFHWKIATAIDIAVFTTGFGVLHAACGLALMRRSPRPWAWSAMACLAALAAYGIAWFRLDFYRHGFGFTTGPFPHFWTVLGFALAALSGLAFFLIMRRRNRVVDPTRLHQSATPFLITSTIFASVALAFELHGNPLFLALAVVMLVLAGVTRLFPLPAARPLVAALAVLGGATPLLMALSLFLGMEAHQFGLAHPDTWLSQLLSQLGQTRPYGLVAGLKYLGGPALLFGATSWLVSRDGKHLLSKVFDVVAAAFAAACCYGLLHTVFTAWNAASSVDLAFLQRSITTNTLFLLAVASALVGARSGRTILSQASIVPLCYALFRIVYCDLLIQNPLLTGEYVGGWPVFNGLLLSLGLPAVWIAAYVHARGFQNDLAATLWRNNAILVLLFLLLTLNVRFWFHAPYLSGVMTTAMEIYAYSAAWLVYGLALLWLGIARKSRAIRFSSLLVMVVTVLKVFLYDASELEGLYRVISFFGLGVSLIGLGFFYSRHLLTSSGKEREDTEA